jgi:formylglycine-generating enzyme required for sulfatase activity
MTRAPYGWALPAALLAALALSWPSLDGAPAPLPRNAREVTNSIGLKLVLIPKGKFLMGSPNDETGHSPGEGPQHEVEISRPFYLGVYEVTQAEFEKVLGRNPSYFSPRGGGSGRVAGLDTRRFPVENVSWLEAKEFCDRLSALPAERSAGRVYRLPTEAEWEHGCRAGAKVNAPFHFGRSLSSLQANFNGTSPYGGAPAGPNLNRPTAVGSYPANAWGLHDMHANLKEWCADWSSGSYYATSPKVDPPGPATGGNRSIRGGSWLNGGSLCRSADRSSYPPGGKLSHVGFRVACTVGNMR